MQTNYKATMGLSSNLFRSTHTIEILIGNHFPFCYLSQDLESRCPKMPRQLNLWAFYTSIFKGSPQHARIITTNMYLLNNVMENVVFETNILKNYSQKNVVSWGMIIEGLVIKWCPGALLA